MNQTGTQLQKQAFREHHTCRSEHLSHVPCHHPGQSYIPKNHCGGHLCTHVLRAAHGVSGHLCAVKRCLHLCVSAFVHPIAHRRPSHHQQRHQYHSAQKVA